MSSTQERDDQERRIREEFERKRNSERQKIQSKEMKNSQIYAVGGMIAPEAMPIIGAVQEKEKEKDENKLKKKEEKLADKESKAIDSSEKDNRELLRRFDDLRSGPRREGSFNGLLTFLVIISAISYIWDFTTNFARPPEFPIIFLYGLMIIVTLVMTKISRRSQWIDGDFVAFFGVIAFTIIFPWVVHAFRDNIPYQWIVDLLGLFLLFPPVIIYLFSKYPDNSFAHKFYVAAIIAIVLIGFIELLSTPTFQGYKGELTIKEPTDVIKGLFKNVGESASNVVNNFQRSFQMAIARATGQQYSGDEEEQRGIMLQNIHAVEKNYYTNSDIYLQGTIKAQNLIGEVTVRTRCYAKEKANGTTYPQILTMVNNDENIIDCHLGQLPKGNYQVFISATFIFITDADIQYYFVDEKTRPELYSSMKIPSTSVATYTGGPVEVGLPSLNQPLRISSDGKNTKVGNYPFGVSLTNKWSQGSVNRGINYTLEVPKGFELKDCNRKLVGATGVTKPDGRKTYTFLTDNQNIMETFDSVTCRMHAVSPADIFSGDVVAIKTFNARAVYEYTIEQSVTVNVAQDIYGE